MLALAMLIAPLIAALEVLDAVTAALLSGERLWLWMTPLGVFCLLVGNALQLLATFRLSDLGAALPWA